MKKSLKKLLKSYGKQVSDIILFGSAAREEDSYADIDIAAIFPEQDIKTIEQVRGKICNLSEKIHFNWLTLDSMLESSLLPTLIEEGFSLKKGKYIHEILGYTPMVLFSYGIAHLNASKKTLFSYALHGQKGKTGILKLLTGTEFGRSAVMIPVKHAREFKDFLEQWEANYQAKRALIS